MACLREPCLAPSYWTFGLGCLCAAHREIAWPWPPVKGCKEVKLTQPPPDVCQSRRYLQELNGSYGKESAYNAGDLGFDPLEKEVATHSSILAWKIPWTEEPGGLQSMGSQKVRHDWATDTYKWLIYFVSSPPPSLIHKRICIQTQTIWLYWGTGLPSSQWAGFHLFLTSAPCLFDLLTYREVSRVILDSITICLELKMVTLIAGSLVALIGWGKALVWVLMKSEGF